MKVWRERIGGIDRYLLGEFEGRARNKVMWNVGAKNRPQVFLGPLWTKAYLFQPHWACPTLLRPLLTLWDLYLCVFACLCAYVCELWRNNWHEEIWIIVFIHTLLIFQTLKLQYLGNLTVSYPFFFFTFESWWTVILIYIYIYYLHS